MCKYVLHCTVLQLGNNSLFIVGFLFFVLLSQKDESQLLLMYNDEFPNGTSSETAAHAKGVVAFDATSGFWLVHSVPRFPPAPDPPSASATNYSFPVTGLRYGQTMLCISLPFSQADLVGECLKLWGEREREHLIRAIDHVLCFSSASSYLNSFLGGEMAPPSLTEPCPP